MRKTILAAGIVRDILFPTITDLERYIESLEFKCIAYDEIGRIQRSDGQWIIRIVTGYNLSPLIEL